MPKLTFPDTQSILAVVLTVGFVALIFFLAISGKSDSDTFKILAGAFSGVGFAGIVSFYFGSSAGSKAKDDAINSIVTSNVLTNGHDQPKL
jgi:hypothetical protein